MTDTPEQSVSLAIRDLIYFDAAKAASLFSQIDEGLLQDIKGTVESARGRRASAGLQAGPVRADIGRDSQDKNAVVESRIPHHHLLALLEDRLREDHQLLDLNESLVPFDYSDAGIRSRIEDTAFVLAEGRAELFDYGRFGEIMPRVNEILALFAETKVANLKETVEYKSALAEIEQMKLVSRTGNDQKRKMLVREAIKALEIQVEQALKAAGEASLIAPHLIDLLTGITQTLMPNRLDLKIRPYEQNPDFRVLANLKRDCLLDADIENILFAYGMKPGVPLTVFGLVTSIPSEEQTPFDSSKMAFTGSGDAQFEQMFDYLQTAFEGLFHFTRFSYYPNVTIYPIAVYRRLGSLLPRGESTDISSISKTNE